MFLQFEIVGGWLFGVFTWLGCVVVAVGNGQHEFSHTDCLWNIIASHISSKTAAKFASFRYPTLKVLLFLFHLL